MPILSFGCAAIDCKGEQFGKGYDVPTVLRVGTIASISAAINMLTVLSGKLVSDDEVTGIV